MKLARLKTLRVILSVALALFIAALFLDLWGWIPTSFTSAAVAFQLVPAFVRTLTETGLWTIGVLSILLVTLLFGRVYCSSMCPLGTLQDLFIRWKRIRDRRKKRRRRWFEFQRPRYALHYGILALTVVLALGGSMTLLNVLEPFSNFGRIMQGVARPVLVGANNAAAAILSLFGSYDVAHIPFKGLNLTAVLVPVLLLGVLAYLSYRHGRFFCNTLCPAGAVLGLVSRVALFKIEIDESTCEDCGLCEKVCKAYCIDAESKRVEFSACVACFNCVESCPTVGVTFTDWKFWKKRSAPRPVDEGRRSLLRSAALPVLLGTLGKGDSGATASGGDSLGSGTAERQRYPVTPPGSRGMEHFSQYCTACHLCISACPTQVLVPSLFDYGIGGVFQPKLDFWASFCNYDCKICSEVCPAGAILPVTLEEKKLVQLGKSVFVKDDCIVITKKTECGACSEHCPTKAVHMVPYQEKLTLPELRNEICVGCGACEFACPTKPRKAIYVEAHPQHQRAEKPPETRPEAKEEKLEEFPF
jgi:ferredoxin